MARVHQISNFKRTSSGGWPPNVDRLMRLRKSIPKFCAIPIYRSDDGEAVDIEIRQSGVRVISLRNSANDFSKYSYVEYAVDTEMELRKLVQKYGSWPLDNPQYLKHYNQLVDAIRSYLGADWGLKTKK